jgi:hypothetical protein
MLEAVDLFCRLRCDKPAYVLGPVRKAVLICRFIVTDKACMELKEQLLLQEV